MLVSWSRWGRCRREMLGRKDQGRERGLDLVGRRMLGGMERSWVGRLGMAREGREILFGRVFGSRLELWWFGVLMVVLVPLAFAGAQQQQQQQRRQQARN